MVGGGDGERVVVGGRWLVVVVAVDEWRGGRVRGSPATGWLSGRA